MSFQVGDLVRVKGPHKAWEGEVVRAPETLFGMDVKELGTSQVYFVFPAHCTLLTERKTPAQTSLDDLHNAWWSAVGTMPGDSSGGQCAGGCNWKIYDSGFTRFEYCTRCNKERPEFA